MSHTETHLEIEIINFLQKIVGRKWFFTPKLNNTWQQLKIIEAV